MQASWEGRAAALERDLAEARALLAELRRPDRDARMAERAATLADLAVGEPTWLAEWLAAHDTKVRAMAHEWPELGERGAAACHHGAEALEMLARGLDVMAEGGYTPANEPPDDGNGIGQPWTWLREVRALLAAAGGERSR